MKYKVILAVLICGILSVQSDLFGAGHGGGAMLEIKSKTVIHKTDRHRFLGTNIGLWHEARQLFATDLQYYMRELGPAYLRIPGGSWSDEYYWNGNGVWDGNKFDYSKLKNGYWQIDYSGYAPGFRVEGAAHTPSSDAFHGNVDVLALHEFVKDKGARAVVTVNFGSGTPQLAAEWVRWANLKKGYGVKYWEIGNELEGGWELGHFLPDGSELTGEKYARRFIEFARAMKAVDPAIKVGGPAAANYNGGFMRELLRDAGDYVDFVSFHTYPVQKQLGSERQVFARAESLAEAVERFRGWIEEYCPARTNEIELAITEWNSKVVEDRDSADLINGLWSAIFVGEMFRCGISFATQWDLLTVTEEGGHGLFQFDMRCIPKSQYWGMYLWSRFMGDELVWSRLHDVQDAYAAVTRSADGLQIMIVNKSREHDIAVKPAADCELGREGMTAVLSQREYTWNYIKHVPMWSHAPEAEPFVLNPDMMLRVEPFSARVFELPFKGHKLAAKTKDETKRLRLRLMMPQSSAVDTPAEVWVLVGEGGKSVEPPADYATITITGPAKSDRDRVRISESAGRFFIKPTDVGEVNVHVSAGEFSADKTLRITAVQEHPEIYWHFENRVEEWGASSTYKPVADDRVRPNQQVAAVKLEGAVPAPQKDTLLLLDKMPPKLRRKHIGGVVFDVSVSPDFSCDDDGVAVNVIIQSEIDHWIPLGSVKLQPLKGKWKTVTMRLPDPKYLKAMGRTYAVRFQLFENGAQHQPVNGTVYLDNVGFLMR